MSEKYQETAVLEGQEMLAPDIFRMYLRAERIAAAAVPGQFVSVYCKDRSRLLPRPISICDAVPVAGRICLVYRTAGAGTKEFSSWAPGEQIRLLGPLGNGYPLEEAEGKRALLIGGGIGIPPLYFLGRMMKGERRAVLGYRSAASLFLKEEFEKAGIVTAAATEDGSAGVKGTVLDAIREFHLEDAQVLYACGPAPMLRALKEYAAQKQIKCYLSLEERMACGVGACLGCVCRTAGKDEHSQVHNARVCVEGPVFEAGQIVL